MLVVLRLGQLVFVIFCLSLHCTVTASDTLNQRYNVHFQTTYIYQYKPAFRAEYSGEHSISNKEEKQNSLTATLYVGVRLWRGAAIYVNPEVAGGNGLSGAFGMGASTNGETFRVGNPSPTLYLARGYLEQVFSFQGAYDTVEEGFNQVGGVRQRRSLQVAIGKFSMGDFMDNNDCSNSPRTQFLNWALMNNAAWDYAANLRGYTTGLVVTHKSNSMTYKVSIAATPKVANGDELNLKYGMARGLNTELTRDVILNGKSGHIRLLAYVNEAPMGSYQKALALQTTGVGADVTKTRQNGRRKAGIGINIDQQLNDYASVFSRIGWNDGKNETWAFTEADRTMSSGLLIQGSKWHRANDRVGIAAVVNGLSPEHRAYLRAGGLGFQLGDGNINYAPEAVAELFYQWKSYQSGIFISGDYQFAFNPGYNKDRGPLQVASVRVHIEL